MKNKEGEKVIASDGLLHITEVSDIGAWVKISRSTRTHKIYYDDPEGPYFMWKKKVCYLSNFIKMDGSPQHL